MKRYSLALVLLASLVFSMPLMADHENGKGNGKGNPHANRAFDDHDRHHGDRDDDRWEHRGKYEVRIYEVREGLPPGWSHGRKTGWGNCGLPPGQAKKYGCRTYIYEGRPYYYYRDEHERIVIRRPMIQINGTINVH